jgi:glycine dehydrogenase
MKTAHAFTSRHIGPDAAEQTAMLHALGLNSLNQLIDETVPAAIRLPEPLNLPPAESEFTFLNRMQTIAAQNRVCKSYIGMGYHDCIMPPVIQRTVLENPSWYTPYTPYQAEIAQGRLELLMMFQTLITDLTGMDVANASLLDDATAAAEAMTLLHRTRRRTRQQEARPHRFLVARTCPPQLLAVLQTRAEPLGIDLAVVDLATVEIDASVFGILLANPDDQGRLIDFTSLAERAHAVEARVAVATDLLSLVLLQPPGAWGADIVLGSAQRFGVPLGYGGPHAAFFAVRDALKRELPGRLVGRSLDRLGAPAYRLALQTREQHIRREKATSNICTAQALLANLAALYAIYHGPAGLQAIASTVHQYTRRLFRDLCELGFAPAHTHFFDTLHVPTGAALRIVETAAAVGINLRLYDEKTVALSLNETTTEADVQELSDLFAPYAGSAAGSAPATDWPVDWLRSQPLLPYPAFQSHHSETKMMRYIKRLERQDLALDTSMIPLGSCTMKLNAAAEMMPVSWPGFSRIHPFAPPDQAAGYHQIMRELEQYLCTITGLAAVSLQPNSGAQGEYAGLLAIRAWHRANGEPHRNVALIPTSAHGTNPASAHMAGMDVVMINCTETGLVDMSDLRKQVATHGERLAVMMLTYPSTFGIFEEHITDMVDLVHAHGGQIYMDGANLNAQVGLMAPGKIGADVCHMNLHKTFAIPHGGGGPGMGPIAVAAHLAPYLPGHPVVPVNGRGGTVSAAPWGSAMILLVSYAYIRLLGGDGLTQATRIAILNANYIKHRLEPYYPVHYSGAQNRVAHELIFDCRPFKDQAGITETDIAKRLMDYGFHAPTVSWPVPGTMMVEPTESESQAELDRFCEAMIAIHGEIQSVCADPAQRTDNPLTQAPHTAAEVAQDHWPHPYTRAQAAYPLPYVRANKFWPAVARIDNAHGDRNLFCSCTADAPS